MSDPVPDGGKRLCKICGSPLASANKTDQCFRHMVSTTDEVVIGPPLDVDQKSREMPAGLKWLGALTAKPHGPQAAEPLAPDTSTGVVAEAGPTYSPPFAKAKFVSLPPIRKLISPIHPRELAHQLLAALPERSRVVLERRFGLSDEPETLETIAKSFAVTRERIRQIERATLQHFSQLAPNAPFAPTLKALQEHFQRHGDVFEESKLLNSVAEPGDHNHILFFLAASTLFQPRSEDSWWHRRWYTSRDALRAAEAIVRRTIYALEAIGKPVPPPQFSGMVRECARQVFGEIPEGEVLTSYLALSKQIRQNPYNEFGLVAWPTIKPRGARDRAYLVLSHTGKPMHFREVAAAISKAGWSPKKAHPGSVHNELIKDERTILVGQGLYALREWGHEPGVLKDVIRSVLAAAGRPLSKEEIVRRVLERRMVKPNSVHLALYDKGLFVKTDEGYTLTDASQLAQQVRVILEAVSKALNASPDQLTRRRRTEPLAGARHIAMYLLRTDLKMSLPEIGRALRRDHTTVIYACRKIEEELKRGPALQAVVGKIRSSYLRS